jgi:dTMP kinase
MASPTDHPTLLSRLIVLEGIDGAGTTTQARLLGRRIRDAGRSRWSTSEPTSGPIGQLLRSVLSGATPVSPQTAAYLFAADRAEHVFGSHGIVAHHAAGEVVVCDRYVYSSYAYQSVDVDAELVLALNAPFPYPGLFIFVDLPVEVTAQRLARRRSREIYETRSFQEKVHDNYCRIIDIARTHTTVAVVDGTQSAERISEKIWESVRDASIV